MYIIIKEWIVNVVIFKYMIAKYSSEANNKIKIYILHRVHGNCNSSDNNHLHIRVLRFLLVLSKDSNFFAK